VKEGAEQLRASVLLSDGLANFFVEALDKKVETMINDAVARAKSNDRKTVRAGDL